MNATISICCGRQPMASKIGGKKPDWVQERNGQLLTADLSPTLKAKALYSIVFSVQLPSIHSLELLTVGLWGAVATAQPAAWKSCRSCQEPVRWVSPLNHFDSTFESPLFHLGGIKVI